MNSFRIYIKRQKNMKCEKLAAHKKKIAYLQWLVVVEDRTHMDQVEPADVLGGPLESHGAQFVDVLGGPLESHGAQFVDVLGGPLERHGAHFVEFLEIKSLQQKTSTRRSYFTNIFLISDTPKTAKDR
jgi:hypothetical protein